MPDREITFEQYIATMKWLGINNSTKCVHIRESTSGFGGVSLVKDEPLVWFVEDFGPDRNINIKTRCRLICSDKLATILQEEKIVDFSAQQ